MLAYYAHSIGSGHCNSAQEFCKVFKDRSLVITSSQFDFDKDIDVINIGHESAKHSKYLKTIFNLPNYAHYLPKSKRKLLFRNYQILECCIADDVKFALIDVSVETAIQFRIAGIPYAYHKMMGNRSDLAHKMAYEASEFLYAFYPVQMEVNIDHLTVKTYYLGFISRYKYRKNENDSAYKGKKKLKILVLKGGESKLDSELLKSICQQAPEHHFTIVGDCDISNLKNAYLLTYRRDVERLVLEHDIVIASCGLNMTSELLALKNKFIAMVEERHFEEHIVNMEGLRRNNLAVEMDFNNVKKTIQAYLELPINENLASFFGTMKNFKNIEELKPYL